MYNIKTQTNNQLKEVNLEYSLEYAEAEAPIPWPAYAKS